MNLLQNFQLAVIEYLYRGRRGWLEFAGLENEGLENDGVEQEQSYMLRTKTNFNGYDALRPVIVFNTNLSTYFFQHLQLYLLKKMNKQKK